MKRRITITIDKDLINEIEKIIDKKNVRSRSHAFEILLRKSIKGNITNAVILAGKLNVLKKYKGKRIIDHHLFLLKKIGIKNIILATERDVKIENVKLVKEEKLLGTAGALLNIRHLIEGAFFVINGDTILDMDIKDLIEFHKNHDGIATIVLRVSSTPYKGGVVITQGNKILKFIEKPKIKHAMLMNAGITIFEHKVFNYIKKSHNSLEKDVYPFLASKGLLYGYIFHGTVIDVRKNQII